MVYPTLEQSGIVLNMFAVVLMGIDLFFRTDQINRLESWLGQAIDSFFKLLTALISSNRFKILVYLSMLLISLFNYKYEDVPKIPRLDIDMGIINIVYVILQYTYNFFKGPVIEFFVLCYIVFWLYDILYPSIKKICLYAIKICFYLFTISPKGIAGSIGIMLFLIGSTLQLWATTLRP
jgi:hypothetical protein